MYDYRHECNSYERHWPRRVIGISTNPGIGISIDRTMSFWKEKPQPGVIVMVGLLFFRVYWLAFWNDTAGMRSSAHMFAAVGALTFIIGYSYSLTAVVWCGVLVS